MGKSNVNRMQVTKYIFASKHPKTVQQVLEILNLEVECHLRANPDLDFDADAYNPVPEKIADKSQKYTLPFKLKTLAT